MVSGRLHSGKDLGRAIGIDTEAERSAMRLLVARVHLLRRAQEPGTADP